MSSGQRILKPGELLRYYRTTGLMPDQMQELVRCVLNALEEPWRMKTGRPKSCGLYEAVQIACMYLRQNLTEEFIGDIWMLYGARHRTPCGSGEAS